MQSDITVLIAAGSRAGILPVLLAALERQTLAPGRFEVVVSGQAGGDGTLEEAERFARGSPVRITCVECAAEGQAAALNLAAKTAKGRMLLFLDTLLLPSPRLVERHLAAHTEIQDPACVFGSMANHPRLRPGALTRWLLPEERPLPVKDSMPFAVWRMQNLSMPKAVFSELGGLDETYSPATAAIHLGLRAARLDLRTVVDGGARAHIWCECSLTGERRRLYFEGRALRRLADAMDVAGLEAHYHLSPPWWARFRDRLLVPYYVRAVEEHRPDDRPFGLARRRILRRERYAGFAHEAAGTPPVWPSAVSCTAEPAVPGDPFRDFE
ncbi:MAG: glycosyltransferase family 2 protein [Candidatus Hydrogenedentes bacterium]|nr:glycosyltransferase family 2 protein [Candidatus Hydrogenedentota bacterium]